MSSLEPHPFIMWPFYKRAQLIFAKVRLKKKKSGLNETEQDSMVPALHVLSLPFVYGKPLAKE